MNKTDKFDLHYQEYATVKEAFQAEDEKFQKWARESADRHIQNAKSILRKYEQRAKETIIVEDLPWLHQKLTFKEFRKGGLIYTYQGKSSRLPYRTEEKEFFLHREWLSLSIWDFNSKVRYSVKTAANNLAQKKWQNSNIP